MSEDASLFTDLPLFQSLTAEEQALMGAAVDRRQLAAGELMFKAGEPGQSMFVVVSGEMELFVTDRTGQKIVLTVCREGDVFGEMAMLDAQPRSASAQALAPTELLELGREDLLQMIRQRPEVALHMLGAMGAMTRKADLLLRTHVARNPQEDIDDQRSLVDRATDWIANFSGSMLFLGINALWFGMWIFLNISGIWRFDPFPFGLLTMIVSLQAIFLSIIVLLAQNRQASKDRIRDDIEYEINVKAELEVAHLHENLEQFREEMLAKMERVERFLSSSKSGG